MRNRASQDKRQLYTERDRCIKTSCENFLYGFKAAPPGPLAPPTRRPGRRSGLQLPLLPALTPVGWREGIDQGPQNRGKVPGPRRLQPLAAAPSG